MKGTWIRILGLLAFVAALAGAGGWWMMRSQGGEAPAPPAQTTEAEKATAELAPPPPAPDPSMLTLPGVIEPYESVPMSAKLTAAIAAMKVRDGTAVAKGQLLCVLDDMELRREIDAARLALLQAQEILRQARQTRGADAQRKSLALASAQRELEAYQTQTNLDLQQSEAALKRAERELADAEALFQAKAVSGDAVRAKREALEDARRAHEQRETAAGAGLASRRKAVEQAQLEASIESVSESDIKAYELAVANSKAELAERERRLAGVRILAPVGGTVRFIPRTRTSAMMPSGQSAEVLGPGVRVYEGDPFLEIATTEQACVRVDVDETDIGRLHVGMPAKITGDAFPGRELAGQVSEIQIAGKQAGQGVTLFPVTVVITSPLNRVRMGMTADVTIRLQGHENTGKGA